MNKLKRLLPSSQIHLFFFGVVLVEWIQFQYEILILFIVYALIIRKMIFSKQLYWVLCIYAIFSVGYKWIPMIHTKNQVVLQQETVKSGYRYTVKTGLFNHHLYTKEDLSVGDVVTIDGDLVPYEPSQFKGDFSPNDYYKSKFVYGVYYQPKVEVIDKIWIPHLIHHQLKSHIESLPKYTQVFVFSLFLGVFETDQKEGIAKIGITHLFVLSGLHVTVLIGLLNSLLFFLPKKGKLTIQSLILGFYLIITLFPISLIRAVLQFIIYEVLNARKIQYTRLDAFSFSGIVMLIINPFFLRNMGFQLTFIVSFIFLVSTFKSDFFGQWVSTFFSQTAVLPITSKISNTLYPIAFFVTPFFIPLFTYVLMPLSWIALYKPIGEVLDPVFGSVLLLIQILEYNAILFKIPWITGIFALVYFGLWVYLKESENMNQAAYRILYMLLFLLVFPNYTKIDPFGRVTFLSVGQGETAIIQRPYGKCTIVIDAYGDVVDYLNQNHIQTIDYLILTHGDYDHDKESNAILTNIVVKQLVLSIYHDESPYLAEHKQIKRLKTGDKLLCGDIYLDILGPLKRYSSSNDQSLVIQTTIEDSTYLFTGDIEFEAEQDLIQYYGSRLQSEILKVGHHGSKTSTHIAFLKTVNPSIAIVSAGISNKFGHPHPEVIEKLHNHGVTIYQTKDHQTITFLNLPFYRRYRILVHKSG